MTVRSFMAFSIACCTCRSLPHVPTYRKNFNKPEGYDKLISSGHF